MSELRRKGSSWAKAALDVTLINRGLTGVRDNRTSGESHGGILEFPVSKDTEGEGQDQTPGLLKGTLQTFSRKDLEAVADSQENIVQEVLKLKA